MKVKAAVGVAFGFYTPNSHPLPPPRPGPRVTNWNCNLQHLALPLAYKLLS